MRDALEVLDLTLRLPVGDRTYVVRPPAAAVGIRLANMLATGLVVDALAASGMEGQDIDTARAGLVINDDDHDFARDCLGAAYDEMLADDLPHPVIELAVSTAFLAWTAGKATAEAWWESGGKAPTLPKRPAGAPPTETPTPQAAATMTKTRVSRNGTKRRKREKG